MDRRIAAQNLATHLFTTEEAVDNTLALMGDLIAAMPRARLRARVAADVGQAAVDHVLEAASALAGARRALVAAHGALNDAKDQIGLRRVTMVGGGDKSEIDGPRGHLHEVKSA